MFEKYIPDLDAYAEAWVNLINATAEKTTIEDMLETITATIYIECMQDTAYHINGKPPAVSFIEKAYARTGHTAVTQEQIQTLKKRLVGVIRQAENAKAILKMEEMKLNLYQTMSANTRNVTGF